MDGRNITCHTWIYSISAQQILTLTDINERLVYRFLGGIVLVAVLICIGLVGNFHVLYFYKRILKSASSYRIFVIFLAILDVFNLAISAPMVLYYLFHPVTFYSDIFCKIFRFIMYFANVASTCALIAIAVDRGQKTLTPLRNRIQPWQAKVMCIISLMLALLLSWPTPILYGVQNVPTGIPNLSGYRCLVEDMNKTYIISFLICQTSFFLIASLLLGILYGLVGWKIYKYGVITKRPSYSTTQGAATERTAARCTCTLLIVTFAYIFSSLPHHILAPVYFVIENFDCELSLPEGVAYYTFIFSCFVNNAINPFIYGFRDKNFWRQVKQFYRLGE